MDLNKTSKADIITEYNQHALATSLFPTDYCQDQSRTSR